MFESFCFRSIVIEGFGNEEIGYQINPVCYKHYKYNGALAEWKKRHHIIIRNKNYSYGTAMAKVER